MNVQVTPVDLLSLHASIQYSQMRSEACLTVGLCFWTILYGVHVTLFSTTLYRVCHSERLRKLPIWLYAAVFITFVFGTVSIVAATIFAHEAWVGALRSGNDKGPWEWIQENRSKPANIVGGAIYPPLFFMQDIILLHRLNVIYTASKYRFTPALVGFFASGVVTSFVLVTLGFFQKIQSLNSPWFRPQFDVSIVHCMFSSILVALMTIAIAGRMLYARRHLAASRRSARLYTSVAAMFIESGAIYSAFTFICILHLNDVLGKPFQRVHFQALVQATGICTNLIVLRVANGHAWTQDTITSFSDLQPMYFADTPEPRPESAVHPSPTLQANKRPEGDNDTSIISLS